MINRLIIAAAVMEGEGDRSRSDGIGRSSLGTVRGSPLNVVSITNTRTRLVSLPVEDRTKKKSREAIWPEAVYMA